MHTLNISVYHKACHIDHNASTKSLKSNTLYIQIHHFCNNQSQKLLKCKIFLWKNPKKCLSWSKIARIHPYPWFNAAPSQRKLCQVVVAKQTWNRHWQREQVSQFLWLIVDYWIRLFLNLFGTEYITWEKDFLQDDLWVEGNYTTVKLCYCGVNTSLIRDGFIFTVAFEKLNWNLTLKSFKSVDLPYFSLNIYILRKIHFWVFTCWYVVCWGKFCVCRIKRHN